jgi:hypothetical protein
MINFNLVKNIISLCFHEHKNSKLTHFSSISKETNFRVLQNEKMYFVGLQDLRIMFCRTSVNTMSTM